MILPGRLRGQGSNESRTLTGGQQRCQKDCQKDCQEHGNPWPRSAKHGNLELMLVYGIDFGTSNSIVGAADPTGLRGFVPLDPGAPDPSILRSLLYFPNARQVYFGSEAISQFVDHDLSGRFIRSIKKQLPSRSFTGTQVDNRVLSLEHLVGTFLGELRNRANRHYGMDVTHVVLGRPARFSADDADDTFAQARLEEAARLAGFRHIEFLAEPVAASIGYERGSKQAAKANPIILTVDYGGGTSDFTVYQLKGTDFRPSDVIAMGGVSVAGDALDSAIMRSRISLHFGTGVRFQVPFGDNTLTMPKGLMERICHPGEISLLRKQDTMEFLRNVRQWSLGPEDRARMDRLFTLLEDQLGFSIFEQIEKTKRGLSTAEQAQFRFSYPGIEITESFLRSEFEDYASDALNKMKNSLDETLLRSGLRDSQIDRILCTGGTARVPWVRQSLVGRFGAEKIQDLDPFRGVARGLAERALELARS